jgi:lipopolysaccharide transport system permease protein
MDIMTGLWLNRELIMQMTKREVLGRYRGSIIGLAWSFFNPVLMLLVYTFVFSVVFKARWGTGGEESKTDFAIVLFVGLIIHGLFCECVNKASGLILGNVNYVKKVVFPLEVLPWVAMGAALFHAAVSVTVLMTAQLVLNQHLVWTVIFFPLIMLPLIFAIMGISWFLSALGVYVRDVSQFTGIFTTVLMFISPVFFPLSAIPKEYQVWMQLNPLAFIIEQSRNTLLFGRTLDWAGLAVSLLAGMTIAWAGFWWFQKTRKGFADVL